MAVDCIGDSVLYFAFGSNLLAARIHQQNPTAVFHTIARLSDYCLDFDRRSYTWKGASATVVPSTGEHVWGVVWLIPFSELNNLDDQEGVHVSIYKPSTVEVMSAGGEQMRCRTYMLLDTGYDDRRPSPHYLDLIIKGAEEHKLPEYYIEKLRQIEHNGYAESIPLYEDVMARHNKL